MSNIGYGQDRLYGAIDDDDDFIEEWRSSWEPSARTNIDDVVEPMSVGGDDLEDSSALADSGTYPFAGGGSTSEADVAWGSWQAAPPMGTEPETMTELLAGMSAVSEETPEHAGPDADEPQDVAEVTEPEHAEPEPASQLQEFEEPQQGEPEAEAAEPLVAPDDAGDLDVVDWEPQPATAPAEEHVEDVSVAAPPTEADQEPPTPEVDQEPSTTEPDHSLGLTGAAAAAFAAASAWGVWGGTAAVPAMPAPSPFQVAEPEPEVPVESQDVTAQPFEPEPAGLYVPEPEVLRIPEPQPSAGEPEQAAFSPGIVTTPIPEPDMYAAPGRSPFHVQEPEPYVIPEPEPVEQTSQHAQPSGETTPIPEPGFDAARYPVEGGSDEPLESADEVAAPAAVAPELAAHEQLHAAAGASAAYDLRVDVFAVLGFPVPEQTLAPQPDDATAEAVPAVAEQESSAAEDVTAAASEEHPSQADDGIAGEHEPEGTEQSEVGHDDEHASGHPRWFDRAKMWAANNLYDPDEDAPAFHDDRHPQDEQNR